MRPWSGHVVLLKLQPLSSDHDKKSTRGWHIAPGDTNFSDKSQPS